MQCMWNCPRTMTTFVPQASIWMIRFSPKLQYNKLCPCVSNMSCILLVLHFCTCQHASITKATTIFWHLTLKLLGQRGNHPLAHLNWNKFQHPPVTMFRQMSMSQKAIPKPFSPFGPSEAKMKMWTHLSCFAGVASSNNHHDSDKFIQGVRKNIFAASWAGNMWSKETPPKRFHKSFTRKLHSRKTKIEIDLFQHVLLQLWKFEQP